MNPLKKLIAYLRWRSAVEKADTYCAMNHCRYYVVGFPRKGKSPGLMVTDRKNFRMLRTKHYVPKDISMGGLLATCVYHTGRGDGKGMMTEQERRSRRELWYMYFQKHQ